MMALVWLGVSYFLFPFLIALIVMNVLVFWWTRPLRLVKRNEISKQEAQKCLVDVLKSNVKVGKKCENVPKELLHKWMQTHVGQFGFSARSSQQRFADGCDISILQLEMIQRFFYLKHPREADALGVSIDNIWWKHLHFLASFVAGSASALLAYWFMHSMGWIPDPFSLSLP